MVDMHKIEEKIHDKVEKIETLARDKMNRATEQLGTRINEYSDFFRREANQLSSMLGSDFWGNHFSIFSGTPGVTTSSFQDDKNIYVKCMVPGYTEKDLTVELNQGYLRIHGKTEQSSDQENYFSANTSEFEETYYVGNRVNEDEIRAEHRNGVLLITVPSASIVEENSPKQIQINATKQMDQNQS